MNIFIEHPKLSIFFVVFTICCFIVVLILPKNDSDYSKKNGNWSKQNSIECQKRSNTYYKCNWNMIEDRCVCKLR